jgi:metallo-beta-lactamase family protein
LVYDLHTLVRSGAIPEIPIYIDSPLAIDATSVFEMHPDVFDHGEDLIRTVQDLFRFQLVHYTRDVEESKALAKLHGPMVIIAASGMAENGRILHHLSQGAADPRNTVLIVGFQAEHTLGRRIVERRPMLKIFGDDVPLRAQVEIINGYSAHADRVELGSWIDRVRDHSPRLKQVWLVHGEPPAQDALATTLHAKGLTVGCPAPRERHAL